MRRRQEYVAHVCLLGDQYMPIRSNARRKKKHWEYAKKKPLSKWRV